MDIVCVSVLLGMRICFETKWRLTHSVRASERAREGRVTVARCTLEMMNSVVLLTHTPGLADAEQLASALPGIFAQMSHSIGCVCVSLHVGAICERLGEISNSAGHASILLDAMRTPTSVGRSRSGGSGGGGSATTNAYCACSTFGRHILY